MLPGDQREKVEQFLAAVMFASKDEVVPAMDAPSKWEKPAAVVFGLGLMLALLGLAVAVPSPTPFQYEVFRIVLAVGVAGFAACIPGLVHLKIGSWLQAAGALAVFAIVYFYSPARLIVDQSAPTAIAAPAK
ncbi:MAG: hypothetical protein NT113_17090 [Hyphomicrobiales bacterium]|nr:hypothetical protein [Hyphomicrobiales bacterium]